MRQFLQDNVGKLDSKFSSSAYTFLPQESEYLFRQ